MAEWCDVCGTAMVSFRRGPDVIWLCPKESQHGKLEAEERQHQKGDHRKTGESGHTGTRAANPESRKRPRRGGRYSREDDDDE